MARIGRVTPPPAPPARGGGARVPYSPPFAGGDGETADGQNESAPMHQRALCDFSPSAQARAAGYAARAAANSLSSAAKAGFGRGDQRLHHLVIGRTEGGIVRHPPQPAD